MIDLTPKHLKCAAVASCPSVHRIVIDGKRHLIVVGENISDWEALKFDVQVDPKGNETAILIEEDLLSGIGCQAEVTAKGKRSAPQAAFQSDVGVDALKHVHALLAEAAEWIECQVEAVRPASAQAAAPGEDLLHRIDLGLTRLQMVIAHHTPRQIEEAGTADERTEDDEGSRGSAPHSGPYIPGSASLLPSQRKIEEAQRADERTAETADASLTSKITPIGVDSMIAEGLKNPEYAMQYVESLREEIASLCASNEKLRAALTKIAKPTVGTELMDTDEEQAEMFWQHIKSFQIIARAALTSPEATETDNG
jgi:hypothetical protein